MLTSLRTLVLLVSLAFLFSGYRTQKEMPWMSWDQAYTQAVKEQKIVIIDVYTDWCGWCKVMDRKTYGTNQVQNKIAEGFTACKINPEKSTRHTYRGEEYPANTLVSKLMKQANEQLRGFPTTIFLVPQQNQPDVVYAVSGYLDEQKFMGILNKLQKAHS